MAYNYYNNKELALEELDKPFAWPDARIGEEKSRKNDFVNEFHGGSLPNGEYDVTELDKPFVWPDAKIGEEKSRNNDFVNEFHGGSRCRGRK